MIVKLSIETAIQAVIAALKVAPSRNYGERVFYLEAPVPTDWPYVVVDVASDNDDPGATTSSEITLDVKVVSGDLMQAMAGAMTVYNALNDEGAYDCGKTITGDSSWLIQTITYQAAIHLSEQSADGAARLYIEGGRYILIMGEL